MTTGARPEWAERMRRERLSRGWSQRDAVQVMRAVSGVTLPESMLDQWKRWERGRNQPAEFYRPLIAAAFNKPVESIFGSRPLSPVHHLPIQARQQPQQPDPADPACEEDP